jgi:hypothetical protein
MRISRALWVFCALTLGISAATLTVHAQRHRATRLGDPETRFAPPLSTPEDLRAFFANESLKPDVVFVLRKVKWPGDVRDLWGAASTAVVREVFLPKGTRIAYMTAREKKRPLVLRDVLWAGAQPIAAYEFTFASKGIRYRVVTPKACSNFWVEEIGPEPPPFVARPGLALTKTLPPAVSLCEPFEAVIAVRNTGNIPLTQVRVTDTLSPGFRTVDGRESLTFEAGALEPGRGMEFRCQLKPGGPGRQENRVQAASAEGVTAEATANTLVRAPALALTCTGPREAVAGRPATTCITVRNTGEATESQVTLTLPIPAGARVEGVSEGGTTTADQIVWPLAALAPGAERQVCAAFSVPAPGTLSLTASAQGACSPPVETTCGVQIMGIPAILLELVDLDDPIEVGGDETYEIRVTNQGSTIATNVKVRCTIEDSQEFVSGGGATPMLATGPTIASEPLPVLAPKAKATWRVVVKALKATDVRFAVQLASDQLVRPVEETEATHQY